MLHFRIQRLHHLPAQVHGDAVPTVGSQDGSGQRRHGHFVHVLGTARFRFRHFSLQTARLGFSRLEEFD